MQQCGYTWLSKSTSSSPVVALKASQNKSYLQRPPNSFTLTFSEELPVRCHSPCQQNSFIMCPSSFSYTYQHNQQQDQSRQKAQTCQQNSAASTHTAANTEVVAAYSSSLTYCALLSQLMVVCAVVHISACTAMMCSFRPTTFTESVHGSCIIALSFSPKFQNLTNGRHTH